jgi:hypothetical protein
MDTACRNYCAFIDSTPFKPIRRRSIDEESDTTTSACTTSSGGRSTGSCDVFAPSNGLSPKHHYDDRLLEEQFVLITLKKEEEDELLTSSATTITQEEIRLTEDGSRRHCWSEKTDSTTNSVHEASTKTASEKIDTNKESAAAPSLPRRKYTRGRSNRRLKTLKGMFDQETSKLESIPEAEVFHSDPVCSPAYKKKKSVWSNLQIHVGSTPCIKKNIVTAKLA